MRRAGGYTTDPRALAPTAGPAPRFRSLSLAILEQRRADALYVATGGGTGPGTIEVLQTIIADLATLPEVLLQSRSSGVMP